MKGSRHIDRVNGTTKISNHSCGNCGKSYSHRQSLHVHKQTCKPKATPCISTENLKEFEETKAEETITKTNHQKQMEELKLAFEKEINKMKKEMQQEMQKEIQKEIQKINIRLEKTDIKTKRKKINKVTRQKIADKQENACGECKEALSPYFELDHIIGLQFGGTDEESNLMALCRECHGKKSIAENQCRKRIQDAIQTILKS